MRELVGVLALRYPKMFEDTGEQGGLSHEFGVSFKHDISTEILGYGLGGHRGVKDLPKHMVDRVSHI